MSAFASNFQLQTNLKFKFVAQNAIFNTYRSEHTCKDELFELNEHIAGCSEEVENFK